jgi:hypothetical protein
MVSLLRHLNKPTMAPIPYTDVSVRQDKRPEESVLGVQEKRPVGSSGDDSG